MTTKRTTQKEFNKQVTRAFQDQLAAAEEALRRLAQDKLDLEHQLDAAVAINHQRDADMLLRTAHRTLIIKVLDEDGVEMFSSEQLMRQTEDAFVLKNEGDAFTLIRQQNPRD